MADEALDRVDPVGFGRALATEAVGLLRHPLSTAGALARWANGALVATGASAVRAVGAAREGPLPVPAKDRRFGDKTWTENALYFWLLQNHLLREQLAKELLDAAQLDQTAERKARMASQLLVEWEHGTFSRPFQPLLRRFRRAKPVAEQAAPART